MSGLSGVQTQYQPVTTTTSGTGINISPAVNGYTASSTTATNPYVIYPNNSNSYYYTTTNSITTEADYDVFRLPKKKMPEMVYVCGRIVTLGIFGSDVDCAYNGKDMLIFSPRVLTMLVYSNKISVSLIYKDEIYHYNVEIGLLSGIMKEEHTKVVIARLLSTIKREE